MFTEDTSIFVHTDVDHNKVREIFLKRTSASSYTEYERKAIFSFYYDIWMGTNIIHYLIPLAQMLHETGNVTSWWCQRPRRNPAGIGVTGQTRLVAILKQKGLWHYDASSNLWRYGIAFADWGTAALAHYGRLLAYAVPIDHRVSTLQEQYITPALMYRPLKNALQGSVSTLKELGAMHNKTGEGWAYKGEKYGSAIASIMNIFV